MSKDIKDIQIENFIELISEMLNELPRFDQLTKEERNEILNQIIERSKFETEQEYIESLL